MKKSHFLFFILINLFASCKEDEEVVEPTPDPIFLFEDGNFEAEPNKWEFTHQKALDGPVPDGHHEGKIDNKNFMTPGNYSLSISSNSIGEADYFSTWIYFIDIVPLINGDFNENMKLVFKATVKGENLEGIGVSVAMDQLSKDASTFRTTQGRQTISGTFDFIEYSLTAPFDLNTQTLALYLVMLNETTGTVYFDNISVYVESAK